MNREDARKLLPIITAFANGAAVQVRAGNGEQWNTGEELSFGGAPEAYRIKPEPKTLFIVRNSVGSRVFSSESRTSAETCLNMHREKGFYSPYTLEEFVQVVK